MPSSIWTRCAGSFSPFGGAAPPLGAAPPPPPPAAPLPPPSLAPRRAAGAGLDSLLFTPFRYPPLRHGSRFGSRYERGIWYGAETLRTAFAEVAYYRLLFLEGTEADLGLLQTDLSAFSVRVRTHRG